MASKSTPLEKVKKKHKLSKSEKYNERIKRVKLKVRSGKVNIQQVVFVYLPINNRDRLV